MRDDQVTMNCLKRTTLSFIITLLSHHVLCDKVLERRTFTELGVRRLFDYRVRRRNDSVKPLRTGEEHTLIY